MKKIKICILCTSAIFLLTMVSGCANKAWNKASEENTVSAYKIYLSKYPDGKHTDEAQGRIEKLNWDKTATKNTRKSYEEYLKAYPDGIHKEDAQKEISRIEAEEQARLAMEKKEKAQKAFVNAKKSITVEELQSFIEKYPDSEHASEANKLIKRMRSLKDELDNDTRYAGVKVGMTESDLIKLLGSPDSRSMIMSKHSVTGSNLYWYIDKNKDTLYCKYIYVKVSTDNIVQQVIRDIGMKN